MATITINIYRAAGDWYGAIWIDGVYDSCDTLDCDPNADEQTARAVAEQMPLTALGPRTVVRVEDQWPTPRSARATARQTEGAGRLRRYAPKGAQ